MKKDISPNFYQKFLIGANPMVPNITTRNDICIKVFLVTSVYSMFQQLYSLQWEVKLRQAYVLCMLFNVSCNHSLKKSQIEERVGNKRKSLQLVLLTSLR